MIVARSRKRELPAAASTIRASPDGMSSEPFNSSRARLLQENAAFAASLPSGVRVLDAGAGTHRYRHLFGHTHYESADFNEQYAPTYVCDLTQIPVPNDRYDAVVINQVLEHVPDPLAVLIELRRILRPGGRLIYTAPLFFEEHLQPYDFYRYTQLGVRHLSIALGSRSIGWTGWRGISERSAISLRRWAAHYLDTRRITAERFGASSPPASVSASRCSPRESHASSIAWRSGTSTPATDTPRTMSCSLRSQIPPRPPTDELRARGYPWYTASFSKALSLNNLAHFRLGAR
jgi:SAM-dependent methyltransferase